MESKPNSTLKNKSFNINKAKNKNDLNNVNNPNKNNFLNSNTNSKRNNNKNTEERTIRSSGRYNLNFIDWNNEWERVNDIVLKIENGEQIEDKKEERRIRNCINKEKEKNGITIHTFEIILRPDTKKECYICLKNFSLNKKVRRLFCKHMFCEECLLPWIKYNSKCPVCKFDFKQNEIKEDDNFNYEISATDI